MRQRQHLSHIHNQLWTLFCVFFHTPWISHFFPDDVYPPEHVPPPGVLSYSRGLDHGLPRCLGISNSTNVVAVHKGLVMLY